MPFLTAQQVNLPTCSPHCTLMLSIKREAANTNFKVIGLTRLAIKPKSTALEADALTTRPSELSKFAVTENNKEMYIDTFEFAVKLPTSK